jgi:tol-pal system protein YbgF
MKNQRLHILVYGLYLLQIFLTPHSYARASSSEILLSSMKAPSSMSSGVEERYARELRELAERMEFLERKIQRLENYRVSESQPSEARPSNIEKDNIFDIPTHQETGVTTSSTSSDVQGNLEKPLEQKLDLKPTDPKEEYDDALSDLKGGKLEAAETKFEAFISRHPSHNLISNAYFWYGESFFKRGIYQKATVNYLKSYKKSNKGSKASDSLLKLSVSLSELGKNQQACGVLVKLESEFPSRSASSIKRAKDLRNKLNCN